MRDYLLRGVCAIAIAACAGVAGADVYRSEIVRPIGYGATGFVSTGDSGNGAVLANDTLSLGLYAYASSSNTSFINTGGDVLVTRGAGATSLGDNSKGTGEIHAQWDEFVGTTTNTVQVIWQSSDNSDMLPAGTTVNGLPANYLNWRVGATDPVNFTQYLQDLNLVTVTVFTSSNGGQSFDVHDLTSLFSSGWNGTDINHALILAGLGTNMLIAEYEFEYTLVPSPGVGILMGGFGLLASRRRR
ncbi:MAG: hypothetical protein H6815_10245 [Phycisphaeraceae bacterium]|nr:hypothetical protein [Phycisphaerales bacterium]MCB9860819.1 hypothetical protein [Phycisphaeraceae bacterium]